MLRAIEVRAGNSVSLVVQSKKEQSNFLTDIFKSQDKQREVKVQEATQKRQELEAEVLAERAEAAKKWFGLF